MQYPRKLENYEKIINRYAKYKTEMGSAGVEDVLANIRASLDSHIAELASLQEDPRRANEPSALEDIKAASDWGPVSFPSQLDQAAYPGKLRGALIGRFAGCALGAPVELVSMHEMELFAQTLAIPFPPENYWPEAPVGFMPRYKVGRGRDFTLPHMKALPPDDDIIYTILALLILEQYGPDFSTEDVAEMWVKLLPEDCVFTAERWTLANLKAGVPPLEAATVRNPDTELIGASIRADGWAYVNPLNPARAAEFAHRDAFLSHRKSGIYSEMYFAAVIAAAFGTSTLEDALQVGLRFIPANCEFTRQVTWAIEEAPHVKDYRDANRAVSERFPGMHEVHAINNACLTIWGVFLGRDDFSEGISQTVAMSYDNDCTAATVGSILGAFMGIDAIPEFWSRPWNNTVVSYLNGMDEFKIDDLIQRFIKIKEAITQ